MLLDHNRHHKRRSTRNTNDTNKDTNTNNENSITDVIDGPALQLPVFEHSEDNYVVFDMETSLCNTIGQERGRGNIVKKSISEGILVH